MPEPSSSSVKVKWPKSKEEVLGIVRHYSKILERTQKVEQIWLFGSYATDEYRYGSDIDLCIVTNNGSFIEYEELLRMFQEISIGIEVQFHIYSSSVFNNLLEDGHSFIRTIVTQGLQIL